MTPLRQWLLCWQLKGWRLVRKHKRGKRIAGNTAALYCPRCGATWLRKVRKGASNG